MTTATADFVSISSMPDYLPYKSYRSTRAQWFDFFRQFDCFRCEKPEDIWQVYRVVYEFDRAQVNDMRSQFINDEDIHEYQFTFTTVMYQSGRAVRALAYSDDFEHYMRPDVEYSNGVFGYDHATPNAVITSCRNTIYEVVKQYVAKNNRADKYVHVVCNMIFDDELALPRQITPLLLSQE